MLSRRRLPGSLRGLAALLAAPAAAPAAAPTAAPRPTSRCAPPSGPNLRLQEQRGQVVLVNFWATWCAPCRQEMPHLNRLYEKYRGSGFVLLGVNVDEDPRNAAERGRQAGRQVPGAARQRQAGQPPVRRSARMPSTVLIDRDGRVRYLHRGYRDGYESTYDKQIRELLKE